MHNVLAIFKGDMKRLMTNAIAAIVAIGLMIVPPMYAWLTTLGFWDPYSNTGNLKVAVSNEDVGYSSALIPTKINAGNEIISELHENKQFDWIFVGKDEAVEGVKSGQYYAAILIPDDFTEKLMTVFSDSVSTAKIDYYTNEKENAIAPRVTDAGATALQTEIDETFTKTVANIALSTTSSLSNFLSGDNIENYAQLLLSELNNTLSELDSGAREIRNFIALVSMTRSVVEMSEDVIGYAGDSTIATDKLLNETGDGISSASSAIGAIADEAGSLSASADESYNTISEAIEEVLTSLEGDPASVREVLLALSQDISSAITTYEDIYSQAQALGMDADILERMQQTIASLEYLKQEVDRAANSAGTVTSEANEAKERLKTALGEAKEKIDALSFELESSLSNQSSQLASQLASLESHASLITSDISDIADNLKSATESLSRNLNDMEKSLEETARILDGITDELTVTRNGLESAINSGDLDEIRRIIGNNPEAIASFLSAPTELVRHNVYEMTSNGSTMSPFYTSLCLWIGAVFLVALTNVNIPDSRRAELKDLKPWQAYLGRYGVFMCIAVAQAIIVCIGNVFFVGVQMQHFWLYLLACCICAIVFSNIVYTLTTSFGSVGKAIAIIGLVMQLGGSGGIFPIQLSAPIFQAIYPWLPFAHSMEAFQSCEAGIYGMQYWISILCLLAFLGASLILGIALRKPVLRLNRYVTDKMEETGVLV